MNVKNISSPQKQFNMIKHMEKNVKGKHKLIKSGEITYNASSTNYTPKIINNDYSG